MYLYHFGFRKLPFLLTPDTDLFCSLPYYRQAFNTLSFALSTGEAFCKITAEVGMGKTMLCRLLINKLTKKRQVAYIPNPVLSPRELKLSLAHELNMRIRSTIGEEQLIPRIQKKLIDIYKKSGPVILIIDEAQAMSDESLETLRLFANLETETSKLIQIVLFAQPELDEKLQQKNLRQLRQRIVFSDRLTHLSYQQVVQYINHRLDGVSPQKRLIFSKISLWLIYRASKGIPRLINIICHKALMLAYGQKRDKVNILNVVHAINDTPDTRGFTKRIKQSFVASLLAIAAGSAYAYWLMP
ncbi:MAG: AAA family ATPase [Kangiellaceae bacterium]|jgi:MSHA biogenesis protein MshM|nr:AAA family ATPase [Kangiellaceae bacterium]